MRKALEWIARAGVLNNENNKGPWGGSGGGTGGESGGSGGGGPRNPWSMPPGGRRSGTGSASLDEFLKRARPGGPGGPGFSPNAGRLWLLAVGALLAVWLLFSSFHMVGPQERYVVSTLGRYSRTLGPGFQLTLPAPISSVRKLDVEATQTESFPAGGQPNLMLTGDQNIIDLAYLVQWNIKNPEDFAFELASPEATVRAVAESAMRATVANVSFNQAVGPGRADIEADVRTRMQTILDEYQSGVRIINVAIKHAAAPAEVDDAFKAVTAAQQESQAAQNNARAYAEQVVARAQGDAGEFDRIYEQYRQAPEVTRRRLYYETMEQVLQRADKTVVEPGVQTYLPLPELRRRAETPAEPAPPAAAPQAPAQENRR